MSLKIFHIVFIILSTVTAVGFGAWGLRHGYGALSIISFFAGLALIFYGQWFFKKIRKMSLAFLVVLGSLTLSPTFLYACSVCFVDPSSQMAQGVKMSVLFLLGMVVPVLIGFAAFFAYLGRRAKLYS